MFIVWAVTLLMGWQLQGSDNTVQVTAEDIQPATTSQLQASPTDIARLQPAAGGDILNQPFTGTLEVEDN